MRKGDNIIGASATAVLGQLADYSRGEHERSGPAGSVTFMKDDFEMPEDMLHDYLKDLAKQGCLENIQWPDDEEWATVTVTDRGVEMLAYIQSAD